MRKKRGKSRVLSWILALTLLLAMMPSSIFAVTGSDVAADGTYTSDSYSVENDDEDDEWDNYSITVTLVVSDGVYESVTVNYSDDCDTDENGTYIGYAVNGRTKKDGTTYVGITAALVGETATADTISNNYDTVSGATYLSTAIKSAALNAIGKAGEASEEETGTLDYTELESAIESASALSEDDYTSDSWATLSSALTAAQTALSEATTQDEIDTAVTTLTEAIDALEEVSTVVTASVVIGGVTYVYALGAVSGYTQIDESGVYYAVSDGETALSGTLYGTANLTYANFYAGDVTSGYTYDAITTATVGDYDMFTYMYDDYDGTQTDGYDILGVTDVNIAVDAEFYVESVILSEAGEELTDAQEAAAGLTLNDDPTEAVSQYKTLDANGYGETVMNVVDTIDDAEPTLSTNSTWGEYEIDLVESSTSYLRNQRTDEGFAVGSNITGLILTTSDGYSVGLAYLANIWIQPYKMSFNATDTTATKNIAYSGDTAKYAALAGKTITTITYLTNDETYVYNVSVYVKDVYSETVSGTFNDDLTTFTLDEVPDALTNPILTVEYTVGSGKTATSYTLYEGTATTDTVTLDTSLIEGVEDGTYSVTLSSDNYADIDVSTAMTDAQEETLSALASLAEILISSGLVSDATLEAHLEEAQELPESEDATMSAADELIEELEEMLTTDIAALTGDIYGTKDFEYADYYDGWVTSGYEYDAITTATTGDYSMFTYEYTDYDEETSTDGYNILGVSDVPVQIDACFYFTATLEAAEGSDLTEAQEAALEITVTEECTTEASQYKIFDTSDGSYTWSEMNVIDTVTDAEPTLSTNVTWGEYEIDVVETSTSYLRNSRSDTYTDDDGNEYTFAVGSGITGIILEAEDGTKVGLSYLANIWIQPYKLSFNAADTTATKNIAYSGDTAKFAALVGQNIVSITYLTQDGAYVYEVSVYVKDVYDETVTGSFDDDVTEFTLDEVPEALENPVLTVEYTVGSGRTATSYTLYSGTATTDTVTLDTSVIEGLEDGTYSVTLSSDNYADIDVSVEILESQEEDLALLIAAAQKIIDGSSEDTATLASHQEEAEEMLDDTDSYDMTDAYDLIDELETLIAEYAALIEIDGVYYLYTSEAMTDFTAISGAALYYTAVYDDGYSGTLYGTASLTYDEFYSGDVTEGYTYDAITTATVDDYAMFTNAYTDYDEETSTDGYDILGVSNVNIAVDASVYVEAAILSDAGTELTGVYAEATEITLNEDPTTAVSQYKTLSGDADSYSYSATVKNVVDTVNDAEPTLSTGSTWGEYEIDLVESSTSYLRNNRTGTYTDENGDTQTFAVGDNITGIILTAVDEDGNEVSVGLAYLANIWIQPYKMSFNATDTTATKNIAYSGDAAKYAALVGKTITTITYLTNDETYVYNVSVYVKEVYDGTVTGSFDADYTTFTLDSVPEELTNAVLTVEYTVGSGKTATSYTLYSGTATTDTVTLDTSVIEGVEDGTYSVTLSSDNYADIDVEIVLETAELEAAIETAGTLTESDYTSDSWAALQLALETAQAALEAAESQEAIDAATEAVYAAIEALTAAEDDTNDSVTLDYTSLNAAIATAQSLTESNYTSDSWAVLTSALTAAQTALSEATTQDEIDAATTTLNAAIKALVEASDDSDDTDDSSDSSSSTSSTSSTTSTTSADTGDTAGTMMLLYFLILIAAAAGMGGIFAKQKKRR